MDESDANTQTVERVARRIFHTIYPRGTWSKAEFKHHLMRIAARAAIEEILQSAVDDRDIYLVLKTEDLSRLSDQTNNLLADALEAIKIEFKYMGIPNRKFIVREHAPD